MQSSPRTTIPLTARLPGYHLGAGLAVLLFAGWIRRAFPPEIGMAPLVQYPCDFLTAVLFPLGSFLAFRALLFQTHWRRTLVVQQLLGLGMVVGLLATYFYTFLVLTDLVNLPLSSRGILPKLVENARNLSTETQRIRQAEFAYQLYGAAVVYRLDNGQRISYEPTERDKSKWHDQDLMNRKVDRINDFLNGVAAQLPYLFGLYAGTFIATYLIGSVILIWEISFRQRPLEGTLTDSDFRL